MKQYMQTCIYFGILWRLLCVLVSFTYFTFLYPGHSHPRCHVFLFFQSITFEFVLCIPSLAHLLSLLCIFLELRMKRFSLIESLFSLSLFSPLQYKFVRFVSSEKKMNKSNQDENDEAKFRWKFEC